MNEENLKRLFKIICSKYRFQSRDWGRETTDGQIYEELNELETRVSDIVTKEVAEIRQRAKDRGEIVL